MRSIVDSCAGVVLEVYGACASANKNEQYNVIDVKAVKSKQFFHVNIITKSFIILALVALFV